MTATQIHGKIQFVDLNGVPLNGGKVYVYEPGTTTDKVSYTVPAATGGTENTQPVVLNSRGEGDIYVIGDCKIKVTDSLDNLIYTLDNVKDITALYSASSGSSLIGYIPDGTGSVATNVQAELRHNYNSSGFTNINVAISTHQTINLPRGTSNLTTSITPTTNTNLVGNAQDSLGQAGLEATVISSSATKIIDCGSSANSSIKLTGMQLIPVSANVSGSYGIYGVGQTFCDYTDIDIRDMDTGIYQEKSQQTRFIRPYLRNNNYGMIFHAAAGTYNVDWFNNIVSIEGGSVMGSLIGPNIDFQGQGLNVKNVDISGIPASGTRASVRVRAGSYNCSFEDFYYEPKVQLAGGDIFLCEGGVTTITNGFVQGGTSGARVGSIVSASGGAIVIVNGITGFDFFTNLVKADGAGTIVYLMPGSIKGSYDVTTRLVETNGGKIIDLRTTIDYGTFTATLTGCTTSPTATFSYQRVANIVTLWMPTLTATSNTTGFTITGLPAVITPVTDQWTLAMNSDTGAPFLGQLKIQNNNILTFYKQCDYGVNNFTNSGVKGNLAQIVTYSLF